MQNRSKLVLFYTSACALSLILAQPAHSQSEWKPAESPLMTRFFGAVSPDNVRAEYPRPHMVRKEWKSLNGLWQFAFDDSNSGTSEGWTSGKTLPDQILVPFTFEAALSGIGKGKEVHEHIWYRRMFDVPSKWKGKQILLNFGAVDWKTQVYINGTKVGDHTGGYTPFTFDITKALKPEGQQEVVVAVYDPAYPDKGAYQPKGKQLGSEGIWYTRTTGIWQTVWLEPVDSTNVGVLRTDASYNDYTRSGTLIAHYESHGDEPAVALSLSRAGKQVASMTVKPDGSNGKSGSDSHDLKLIVPDVLPWSPESPELYDIKLTLSKNGKVIDEVTSYCAFRTVGIANGRLTLNGKPYFYRGVLDQGYWPDGILTPPSDAAIRNDVVMTKRLGFNMARKHVKVDDPRWYYWCDKLGLAVWQDMPSSHNLRTAEAKQNFTNEWKGIMDVTRAYPCVVHWIPFNENWGNPVAFQDEIVKLTRSIDSSRPITDASGWTQRSLTDVVDSHNYSNNLLREGVKNPVKPKVVGEYGGIALPIKNHTWTQGWGYQTVRDPEGLIRKIRMQTTQLHEAANLSGFVYTQLTDVEQELNGLMTYDRVPKAEAKLVAAVFEGKDRATEPPPSYIRGWMVLGPIPTGTNLGTAANSADSQRIMQSILDTPYLQDEDKFTPHPPERVEVGNRNLEWRSAKTEDDQLDFHKVFGREYQNAVAYAVAYIDSPEDVNNVTLLMGSDDGAVVWLNGRKVWTVARIRGVNPDEDTISGLSLKKGRNVLIIKVGQGVGGWGVCARFEIPQTGKKAAAKGAKGTR